MFLLLFGLMCQLPKDVQTNLNQGLQSLDRFEVSFRQETYSDFTDDTVAEGVLMISRPGKLRMEYRKGERKLFISDGTTYYEKDIMGDTESRMPLDELSSEPLVRLMLFGSDPQKHFIMDRRNLDEGTYIYRLRPRNDESYYLEITFDSNWLPQTLEVYGEEGEGTRFSFWDYRLKPEFSETTFTVPE